MYKKITMDFQVDSQKIFIMHIKYEIKYKI